MRGTWLLRSGTLLSSNSRFPGRVKDIRRELQKRVGIRTGPCAAGVDSPPHCARITTRYSSRGLNVVVHQSTPYTVVEQRAVYACGIETRTVIGVSCTLLQYLRELARGTEHFARFHLCTKTRTRDGDQGTSLDSSNRTKHAVGKKGYKGRAWVGVTQSPLYWVGGWSIDARCKVLFV